MSPGRSSILGHVLLSLSRRTTFLVLAMPLVEAMDENREVVAEKKLGEILVRLLPSGGLTTFLHELPDGLQATLGR